MVEWHRLFGLVLMDYFTDSPFDVEVEKDLSVQQQLLDVTIIRKRKGRFVGQLPDGLDNLGPHNLLTFRSHHSVLDDWTLKELTGHYVAYRKLVSPRDGPLLPESEFRLYAVSSRFPQILSREMPLIELQRGVYECRRGTDAMRIVVVGQLPQEEHNAPLQLFSASAEQIGYGAQHYRRRSQVTSGLVGQLLRGYSGEGIVMSYTLEDFRRDYVRESLATMSPAELREFLATLPPEMRLEGLAPEKRLEGLSAEEIEQFLQKLKREKPTKQPRSRRKSK